MIRLTLENIILKLETIIGTTKKANRRIIVIQLKGATNEKSYFH